MRNNFFSLKKTIINYCHLPSCTKYCIIISTIVSKLIFCTPSNPNLSAMCCGICWVGFKLSLNSGLTITSITLPWKIGMLPLQSRITTLVLQASANPGGMNVVSWTPPDMGGGMKFGGWRGGPGACRFGG